MRTRAWPSVVCLRGIISGETWNKCWYNVRKVENLLLTVSADLDASIWVATLVSNAPKNSNYFDIGCAIQVLSASLMRIDIQGKDLSKHANVASTACSIKSHSWKAAYCTYFERTGEIRDFDKSSSFPSMSRNHSAFMLNTCTNMDLGWVARNFRTFFFLLTQTVF